MVEGMLHTVWVSCSDSSWGEEGLHWGVFFPQDCNVIEVFQLINYVQTKIIIKLVTMPYITELEFVIRKSLGNGNVN